MREQGQKFPAVHTLAPASTSVKPPHHGASRHVFCSILAVVSHFRRNHVKVRKVMIHWNHTWVDVWLVEVWCIATPLQFNTYMINNWNHPFSNHLSTLQMDWPHSKKPFAFGATWNHQPYWGEEERALVQSEICQNLPFFVGNDGVP